MKYGLIAALVPAACALGQDFVSSFELRTYVGSGAGVPISPGFASPPAIGAGGWYVPAAGALPLDVFTYTGNTVGLPQHPSGGPQFAAARDGASGERGLLINSGAPWTGSFDVAVAHNGAIAATPDLGAFSLEPPASRGWKTFFSWNDAGATSWTCAFVPFNAAGVQSAPVIAAPEFGTLEPRVWYRVGVKWSYTENRITEVSLTRLDTGATTVATPAAWYLGGGAAGTGPQPQAIRLTATGATNVVGLDHVSLRTPCYGDCNNDGVMNVIDFGCFQTEFVSGNMYADCDGSGHMTVQDFGCWRTVFVQGCP